MKRHRYFEFGEVEEPIWQLVSWDLPGREKKRRNKRAGKENFTIGATVKEIQAKL